jgi:hypothetical protein
MRQDSKDLLDSAQYLAEGLLVDAAKEQPEFVFSVEVNEIPGDSLEVVLLLFCTAKLYPHATKYACQRVPVVSTEEELRGFLEGLQYGLLRHLRTGELPDAEGWWPGCNPKGSTGSRVII